MLWFINIIMLIRARSELRAKLIMQDEKKLTKFRSQKPCYSFCRIDEQ